MNCHKTIHHSVCRSECSKCECHSNEKNEMNNHKRTQHRENILKCMKCNFEAQNEDRLNEHKIKVHDGTPIKCSLCDYRTFSNEILAKHMKVAMGHKKQIECRYFKQNLCRYGKMCRFKHTSVEQPNEKKAEQCKFYDKCRRFPKCGNNHNEICKYQQNCRNQNCRFVHLEPATFLYYLRSASNNLRKK